MRISLLSSLIAVCASFAISSAPLSAQESPQVRVGARMRFLDVAAKESFEGQLLEYRPDSLVLQLDGGTRHAVALTDVRIAKVQGARSRRYGFRHGQSWGAVLGIVAGVIIHFSGEWFSDAPFADSGPQIIISATGLGGAAIGGTLGFIIGRRVWHDVPLPLAAP